MHVFTKEKQNKNYPTFLVTLVHCVKYYTHVFYNMNYLALIITFQGLLLYLLLGGASKKKSQRFHLLLQAMIIWEILAVTKKNLSSKRKRIIKGYWLLINNDKSPEGIFPRIWRENKTVKKCWGLPSND